MREQLIAELPRKVDAPTLAAAALRRSCDLGAQYPADFPDRLTAMKKGGKKRKVTTWIRRAEKKAEIQLADAADIYLATVFVSPAFAKEFAGERPGSAAFERLCARFTDRLTHDAKASWDQGAATGPTARDRTRLPIMARALEVGEAEFSLLVEAHSYLQEDFMPNPNAAATYRRFHIPIRRAFEAMHGTILEEYWCTEVPVGTVRTTGGTSKVKVHFDGDYAECLIDLFNRCKEVNRKGREFLPRAEYETLAANLYGLLTDLLSMVDDAADGKQDKNAAIKKKVDQKPFFDRLGKLEAELDAGSARQGQRWYALGAAIGLLLIGGIFAGAAIATSGHWNQIFEGAIFGAAGALASVLFRMSRGKLEVDAQQGTKLIGVSAMVKPLTGAIFGGIVVALLLSGLAQIEVPVDEPKRFFFLAVLAFIAGFSERFAPNLLQFTEERVEAEEKAKPDDEAKKPTAGAAKSDSNQATPAAAAPAA